MTQITIRDVGIELHRSIKEEAKLRGLSMNRYILLVLRDAVGLGDGKQDKKIEFYDLDHLAGSWTADEYQKFERQLDSQRNVDDELWQ